MTKAISDLYKSMRYKEVTVQLKDGPRTLKKKRSMVPFWIVVILLILGLSMLMISIPNNIRFDQFGTIFSQMFVPSKWSLKTWDGYRDYIFNTAIIKILQTLEMVSIATFLGTCISVPFYILASSNIFTSKWVHMPVRILLNIFRSIPTFVLAVIATIFFGFNETSGIIAMALFTGGVLFKLMYEQIETCDMNPYEASRSTGASILQAYNIAISPQIKPTLISNVIYVFEINVRASVILGFVGAGGIGQLLSDAIESTQYDKVGAILIPLFIVVIFLQFLSSFLRRRIH